MDKYNQSHLGIALIIISLLFSCRAFAQPNVDLYLIHYNDAYHADSSLVLSSNLLGIAAPFSDRSTFSSNQVAGNDPFPSRSALMNFSWSMPAPFLHFQEAYQLDKKGVLFSKKPFTKLEYLNAGPVLDKFQLVKINHTQQLGEPLSIGFDAVTISSKGNYDHEEGKMYQVGLNADYHLKRLRAGLRIHLEKFSLQENGGLEDVEEFLNAQIEQAKVEVPMALTTAQSITQSNKLALSVNYTLADSSQQSLNFRLFGDLKYLQLQRNFSATTFDSAYYAHLLLDTTFQNDSMRVTQIEGQVGIQMSRKHAILPEAHLTLHVTSMQNYYRLHRNYFRNAIRFSSVAWNNQTMRITVDGRFYIWGYGAGDYRFEQTILFNDSDGDANPFKLSFAQSRYTPDWLYQNFRSLPQVQEVPDFNSVYQNRILALWQAVPKALQLNAEVGLFSNYSYFNENAVFTQEEDLLSYAQTSLHTKLSNRSVAWELSLTGQWSSKEHITSVPNWMAFTHFHWNTSLFKNELGVQFGLNAFAFSPGYLHNYTPVLGYFYNSTQEVSVLFPLVDAYMGFNIKNSRITVKYENLLNALLNKNGLSAGNYPLIPARLTLGVSVYFFD